MFLSVNDVELRSEDQFLIYLFAATAEGSR
jgi:hypothetical protein